MEGSDRSPPGRPAAPGSCKDPLPAPEPRLRPTSDPPGQPPDPLGLSPLFTGMPSGVDDRSIEDALTRIASGEPVDWAHLDRDLTRWRTTLARVAQRVEELATACAPGMRSTPPVSLSDTFLGLTWRLTRVFECEAHYQAHRRHPERAGEILCTLLKLDDLVENRPPAEARLTWYHDAMLTRSLVLAALRDPRLYQDASATALTGWTRVAQDTAPARTAFEVALLGEPEHQVAALGRMLFQQRGQPFPLPAGAWVTIPHTAAERGLWLETAREQVHALARRAMEGLDRSPVRALEGLRKVCRPHVPPRHRGPAVVARRVDLSASAWTRSAAFVSEVLRDAALLILHTYRLFLQNLQGHRLLVTGLRLERYRQHAGTWPRTLESLGLPPAEVADPVTGSPLLYRPDGGAYRLEPDPAAIDLLHGH